MSAAPEIERTAPLSQHLMRIHRRVLAPIVALGCAIALMLGFANTAAATEQVDCLGGPPPPITLVTPEGDVCFGGNVGLESVDLFVNDFSSGGYYVNVFFRSPNAPGETLVVSYEPDEFTSLNVRVVGIEIVPPFASLEDAPQERLDRARVATR